MNKLIRNKKLLVIIGFALLTLSSILMFITIWNLNTRHPDLAVPNIFFFLVIFQLVIFAVLIIFLIQLIPSGQTLPQPKPGEPGLKASGPKQRSREDQDRNHPTNIDIDKLSAKIIPPYDSKDKAEQIGEKILQNMAGQFNIGQALLYLFDPRKEEFFTLATYAFTGDKNPENFKIGNTLPGQAAKNGLLMKIEPIPEDYRPVASALGEGKPTSLVFLPLLNGPDMVGVIEAGLFRDLDESLEWALDKLSSNVAKRLSKFTQPK